MSEASRIEVSRIIDQMDRAMNGEAWHGPHLEELLGNVSAQQAAAHPVAGAHSIWELVNHIGSWNAILAQRASGKAVAVTAEQDWPPVKDTSAESWKRALDQMQVWADGRENIWFISLKAWMVSRRVAEGKL